MTDLDVFGLMTIPSEVEDAVTATLQEWMPTYLRAMERKTDRNVDALPEVASWRAADTMSERFPEQQIPACQVMVATEVEIHTEAESAFGIFMGDVDILVASPEPEPARRLAYLYAYAMGLLLTQQPRLDGSVKVMSLGWERIGVPAVGAADGRWLALGSIHVTIGVEDIMEPLRGPTAPILTVPESYPQAQSERLIATLEDD